MLVVVSYSQSAVTMQYLVKAVGVASDGSNSQGILVVVGFFCFGHESPFFSGLKVPISKVTAHFDDTGDPF